MKTGWYWTITDYGGERLVEARFLNWLCPRLARSLRRLADRIDPACLKL